MPNLDSAVERSDRVVGPDRFSARGLEGYDWHCPARPVTYEMREPGQQFPVRTKPEERPHLRTGILLSQKVPARIKVAREWRTVPKVNGL